MKADIPASIQDTLLSTVPDTFVNEAKSAIGPSLVRIVLYGSYARGSNDAESDIDLLLLLDSNKNNLRKYEEAINNVSFDLSIASDILLNTVIMEYDHFHTYLDALPFYTNIEREGIILYERPIERPGQI